MLLIEANQIQLMGLKRQGPDWQVVDKECLSGLDHEIVNGVFCNPTLFKQQAADYLRVYQSVGKQIPVLLILDDQILIHEFGSTNQLLWQHQPEGHLQQCFDLGESYYVTRVAIAQVLQYYLLLNSFRLYVEVVTGYSAALLTYLRSYQMKINFNYANWDELQGSLRNGDGSDMHRVAVGAILQGGK